MLNGQCRDTKIDTIGVYLCNTLGERHSVHAMLEAKPLATTPRRRQMPKSALSEARHCYKWLRVLACLEYEKALPQLL